jgi:ABC-type branched-subunit amino acid transport system permease subunit
MEPIYYREALSWIRSHPLDWAVLELKKMFYLVVPIGPSYRVHSMRYLIASVVSFALLLPVGLAGWLRLGGARVSAPGVFLAAGTAILLCLIFFPQERFRIPSIDPALIVSAGALWRGRGGSPA